jgi:hypothetical protein
VAASSRSARAVHSRAFGDGKLVLKEILGIGISGRRLKREERIAIADHAADVITTLRLDPVFRARFPGVAPVSRRVLLRRGPSGRPGVFIAQRQAVGIEYDALSDAGKVRADREMRSALRLARRILPTEMFDRWNRSNFLFDGSGRLQAWFDPVVPKVDQPTEASIVAAHGPGIQ